MQSPALSQNIFKFCTFLPKVSNILPFLALFQHCFALFLKNHMHALTFSNRSYMHTYIHTYLHIYHAYHTCHTIIAYRFCKYISYKPYHAMHTYSHTIHICIVFMHTKIPYIYIITHIHTNTANIDIIDTRYINTYHTIHYLTFVYLSALTY